MYFLFIIIYLKCKRFRRLHQENVKGGRPLHGADVQILIIRYIRNFRFVYEHKIVSYLFIRSRKLVLDQQTDNKTRLWNIQKQLQMPVYSSDLSTIYCSLNIINSPCTTSMFLQSSA